MTGPRHAEVIAVMREHLWSRLGLVLEEYYTEEELSERWIAEGLERGDSAEKLAETFARHMYEKYNLTWLDASTYSI